MFAVMKKELKSYLLSPTGYIFIGLFLLIFSIFFYSTIYQSQILNFEYLFYNGATILTFITPVLTMRLFAEERKSGTEQLLLTSPISITKIVIAKFISAVIITLIAIACTSMFLIIIRCFGTLDITAALVTIFGFILLSMAYISIGILASSITENQIIAALITIITFVATWVLPEFLQTGASFSLINMFSKFTTGQINIAYTVTYLAFTVLCLILTITVMQRRKSAK